MKRIVIATGIISLAACTTLRDPIPDSARYAYFSKTDVRTTSACVLRNATQFGAGTTAVERTSSIDGALEVTLATGTSAAVVVRSEPSGGSTQVTAFARPADGKRFVDPLLKNCAAPYAEPAAR